MEYIILSWVYFNAKLYARIEEGWENGKLEVIDPIKFTRLKEDKVSLQISHLQPASNNKLW